MPINKMPKIKILAFYSLGVGAGIILMWVIFFFTRFTEQLQMDPASLFSHVIAELFAALLSVIGGISLLLSSKRALIWYYLGLGAVLYAIINAIGYYYSINILWLFVILTIALVFQVGVFAVSVLSLKIED